MLTPGEVSRALNAVSTTLRDQRDEGFDASRVQAIARGALSGADTVVAVATGPSSGELRASDGGMLATVAREGGEWQVRRERVSKVNQARQPAEPR